MPSQFITIESVATQGALGALARAILICTREAVDGFTADTETGLYKINSTDEETFAEENPTSLGLINALATVFSQNYAPDFVYILSEPTGITSGGLTTANTRPRDWSFITLVDQYQGDGDGASVGDTTAYFEDMATIGTWATSAKQKIVVHTYSVEQADAETPIVLPTELEVDGTLRINDQIKTIVCNSKHQEDEYAPIIYDNIALAWMAYCLNGVAIARSWGSLSDAHDFNYISSDTYNQASRSLIENNSLGQYNGAKDRAGSVFEYDTQMNDNLNPPLTFQIETLTSMYYIDDYTYVFVHNSLQAAGQTGLPTDNVGIQRVLGLVIQALTDCYNLGLILTNDNGTPAFSVKALTASEVTVLSPNWQTTGIWPSGVIQATIKPFGATHYITINFAFV